MYQRCFDNASETLFVAGKTPRLSRFAISDDPKWESGHHVHDNETELILRQERGSKVYHRFIVICRTCR
ncbi:AraC family transcriptional regulator [Escherichia coli]|uniref:AraC family transcriptional regulator n=1 Tax=Escherichia coli TaxID=562 RepID=A0A376KV74_ECOLX|nr:AraC family transcriptional regulator [Escherichia coli]